MKLGKQIMIDQNAGDEQCLKDNQKGVRQNALAEKNVKGNHKGFRWNTQGVRGVCVWRCQFPFFYLLYC